MRRPVVVALVLTVVACVPSPKELAAQASTDSKGLIQEALETGQQTNTWQSVDRLFVNSGATSASARPKMPDATASDATMDLLAKYSDRIFADENVVERPVGALIFGLSGTILCTDPRGTTAPSPDCVQQVDKMQLRLKATGGPDLTLQVGPDHLEPVVLKLRAKQSISVEEDLGATERALLFLNSALGTSSPANGATFTASGRVELKLLRHGDHDFTVSYSNLAPIDVKYTDAAGVQRSWTSEARTPVASVRVEGPARKLTVLVDQGRLEGRGLSTDYYYGGSSVSSVDGGSTYVPPTPAPISYLLAGLSAELNLAEGKDPTLTRVGLGDQQSSITWDGRKLLSVDLNATMGRHFDVAWKPVGAGARLDFTPGVEAAVYLGFAALPADAKADPSFLDTTFTGSFKAASGPASMELVPSTANTSGSVRIVAGTLSLSSSQPGQAPRQFTAGTCLAGRSSSVDGGNPVLDVFSAVACP